MFQHTSKFELNLIGSKEIPNSICSAAIKYRASSIVIDNPALVPPMLATRYSTKGNWKLILAVDFPHGKQFGFANKFKSVVPQSDACDGFDILLTLKNENETANEIKGIVDYIGQRNSMQEIRFVIDAFSRSTDQVKTMLKGIKRFPSTQIRLDHHLSLPNLEDSKIDETIKLIREYTGVSLNLSTNVTLDRMDKYKGQIKTFGVDLKAAAAIEQQLQNHDRLTVS